MIDALAAAGWAAGWLVAGRVRRLPPGPATGQAADGSAAAARAGSPPSVSVVVPVRNEATRLPGLLAALSADAPPGRPTEVIVVDDGSSDGGGALAAAGGATVITVEPPAGWTGKSWACWRGALAASGDIVIFLDADTAPAPGFIARLAAASAAGDAMVSVQPTHLVAGGYERASAACNVVALMAGTGSTTDRAGQRRWWRRPVAFGPAIAVPRARYLDAGGHGLVAGDVVDDVALAQALDRAGITVAAYGDAGEGAITYRMYPDGPGSLVEGWTKNLAAGAGKVPPLRAALIGLWIAGALHAALGLAGIPPGGRVSPAPLVYGLLCRAGRRAVPPGRPVRSRRGARLPAAPAGLRGPVRPVGGPPHGGAPGDLAGSDGGAVRPAPAVLVDVAVWAGWGTSVGLVAARLAPGRFAADGPLTRIRGFEQGGRMWERTAVRRWKDRVPELGTLFGGVSKRRLPAPGRPGRDRLAAETRRAELVHWAAMAPVLVMPWWNPAWVTAVMVSYAVVANGPFIVIQRYNRARLARVAARAPRSAPPTRTAAR